MIYQTYGVRAARRVAGSLITDRMLRALRREGLVPRRLAVLTFTRGQAGGLYGFWDLVMLGVAYDLRRRGFPVRRYLGPIIEFFPRVPDWKLNGRPWVVVGVSDPKVSVVGQEGLVSHVSRRGLIVAVDLGEAVVRVRHALDAS